MNKPVIGKRNKKFHQGKYVPKNPEKYIGDVTNIIYRSGWERQFLRWCDITSTVEKYGSEEMVIPYISPIDGQQHKYYIDFVLYVKQQDDTIKKFAVEIKPYNQTIPPKMSRGKSVLKEQNYIYACKTYAVNQAKWESAHKICAKLGYEFIILTERQLMVNK